MNKPTESPQRPTLALSFGLAFEDLYCREGLEKIDAAFRAALRAADVTLDDRLASARADAGSSLAAKQRSELIVELAPHVEDFIGDLFQIGPELRALTAQHHDLAPLYSVKRRFVQKKALTGMTAEKAAAIDGPAARAALEALFGGPVTEDSFVAHVSIWIDAEGEFPEQLAIAQRYAAWAALAPAGHAVRAEGVLFRTPHKHDPQHLVPSTPTESNGLVQLQYTADLWRDRDGFGATDSSPALRSALDNANYCIKCHNQGKDSCSHGLQEKDNGFKSSVFGVTLAGCPLEEKISEMNLVKSNGNPVGALAIVTVDNPMTAGTGHRICNDCMKACIYQKQEPVDIPQIESRTLKDVLELPWGFEIYSLLTRWNPLNFGRPFPRPATGKKVLVVGLGPAGYTLSHHLMNDGHTVIAVDGLKIEPLDGELSGVDLHGNRVAFRPIHTITDIYERLDERIMAGFGGVAEYGITVRWNKNFLKVIRLLLERRAEFALFGGVRFGGALTIDSAFELGFDHVALCTGAGRPTIVPMKNGLARGVRQASDLLMALQLTGAAKAESLASFQLRMPIVVIGGGLTAIDTATESMAYYVVQVERFLNRFEALGEVFTWTGEEAEIANEFLDHGRAIRAERAAAAREGRAPRFIDLLHAWGGVTMAYRRRLIDAPSYTLNHEEVAKAFEEGVRFAECLSPEEVVLDATGAAAAIVLQKFEFNAETGKMNATGESVTLPARTVLVAAGTQPNTVLASEDGHNLKLDGRYFQAYDESGNPVKPEHCSKPGAASVLVSLRPDGGAVSFFGDLHPSWAGNVVRAMGSAKRGHPVVSQMLARRESSGPAHAELTARFNDELRANVQGVTRLAPGIVEIVVRAPMAARAFQPGQFYRLQNFETLAPHAPGSVPASGRTTVLAMEGLPLTAVSVDREAGLVTALVFEDGGASDLCSLLKPGEPVVLMGPTGTACDTAERKTVLLAGEGFGNSVLVSLGRKLRDAGSRVLFFAAYATPAERCKAEEIESAADAVVWVSGAAPGFTPARPQDSAFVGDVVQAIQNYGAGVPGSAAIPLAGVDRLIVVGPDAMMGALQQARHTVLRPYLKPDHQAIGNINSPMQCMMKEICAQCLQVHKDPATGKETVVYSCVNRDQALDLVDFGNLRARLSQNSVQEKLTKLWIDRSLRSIGARGEKQPAAV